MLHTSFAYQKSFTSSYFQGISRYLKLLSAQKQDGVWKEKNLPNQSQISNCEELHSIQRWVNIRREALTLNYGKILDLLFVPL